MNNFTQDNHVIVNSSISPSSVIDHIISTSMRDLSCKENSLLNYKQSRLSYRNFHVASRLKRKHQKNTRTHYSKIDALRRLAWNNTSPKQLERAEKRILETLKSHFDGRYIHVLYNSQKIWTIYSNVASKNIPIVLIHGFGGGVGLWSVNLDQLCSDRPVYAIDLPGFARSTRPRFYLDPKIAEKEFIDMIEEWRIAIGLDKPFILLGHSFGGFLSADYAIKYPKYIKQLVLIDPWGFAQKPDNIWQTGRLQCIPAWLRTFSPLMMKLSPLAGLRVAGRLGVPVMKHFRSDLHEKFKKLFDDDRILEYIYHCNAQLPTGEEAFRTISDCYAWAKMPIIERIDLLDERIPIYFLHGEQSWISAESSFIIQSKRPNVFVEIIKEAGHHIYADTPEEFEMYLKRILYNS